MQLDQIEQALQAPVMDAVIALSERVQTLENNPEGRIYTAYRAIDQTLSLGYSENIDAIGEQLRERDFVLLASRRGTRREQRLLLLTLKEIGIASSYSENCFSASPNTVSHLRHLGWPLGNLKQNANGTKTRKRFNQGRCSTIDSVAPSPPQRQDQRRLDRRDPCPGTSLQPPTLWRPVHSDGVG